MSITVTPSVVQRSFAVSTDDTSPCGPWNPVSISIPGDDVVALQELIANHFPQHRIVELLGPAMATIIAPLAFIVEVEFKDVVDLSRANAQALLKVVIAAAQQRVPTLTEAMIQDPGFRASFMWDGTLKQFALHVVCPNTYLPANELLSAIRGMHLPSTPFSTASKGFLLQDTVLGCPRCVPIYMGPNYTVLQPLSETSQMKFGIICTRPTPSLAVVPVPQPISGGLTSSARRLSFGDVPAWQVPVERTIEFLVRMIRSRTSEFDDLCCDVVYTECGTLPHEVTWSIIGMPPRIGMKERSVRFLYWIAKRVAIEDYTEWIYEQCAIIAQQFSKVPCTDELLQRLFLLAIEGDYIAISDGSDANALPSLYYFNNIWKLDRNAKHLGKAISRLVTTFIGEELKNYMQKTKQSELYNSLLGEVVRLNYMTTLRAHTIKAVTKMVSEEVFFDEDPNLLGCNNVIIEMGPRGAFARPGRPEDLISMTTHVHYQTFSDEECAEVRTLFRKLFADEEYRFWFMRVLSSLICGMNPERCFYFLIGCARNGKSGLLNLLELVFGDYFGRFSSKALNERSDPSSTSPELATMHGKRLMVTSELKAGAQMEADILKALTGDDAITVRALYKNPRVLRMMARIIIASNNFPVFINADKALRDRALLGPMEAVFDNFGVPKSEFDQYRTQHFPADPNYRETLRRIAPKMLFMMVEGYAEYKLIGLEPKPKKVRDLCEAYWHEVGVQSRFITDCIEFVDAVAKTAPPTDVKDEDSPRPSSAIVSAAKVLPDPPVTACGPASSRPKLTYTTAYDRFTAWALTRQIDVSKYPRFTFKSLMDSELASTREHKIEFAVDGWIGCRLRS